MLPRAAVVITLGLSGAACAASRSAEAPIEAYRRALVRGDVDGARETLAEPPPVEAFERDFERRHADRVAMADWLLELERQQPDLRATSAARTGPPLRWVLVDGSWKVAGGLALLERRTSPAACLDLLIEALATRDADRLLDLSPADVRARLTVEDISRWLASSAAEVDQLASELRQVTDARWIEAGDFALLRYGAHTLRLVRESGLWFVADFR
jgi:hypothetical protein